MSLTKVTYSMIQGAPFSVLDYGADPTGVLDSTAAFQNAINEAAYSISKPYNAVVVVPSGFYRLDSSITVKQGVCLRGEGIENTRLEFYDLVNAAIKVESFSEINGFTFFYPQQVTGGTPIIYPATIEQATASVSYITIAGLRFLRSYIGISLGVSGGQATKVLIQDVEGFPFKTGIEIDQSYDVVRVVNVHFNPNIEPYGSDLKNWVFNNGTAFLTKRVDAPQFVNIHCYGYEYGMYMTFSPTLGGSANMVQVTNFLFDLCKCPIYINACQDGVYFSNGICTSTNNYVGLGSNGTPCYIGGGLLDNNYVNFSNTSFRKFWDNSVTVGTNAYFSNCEFDDFNYQNTGGFYEAVKIDSNGISVAVSNCRFNLQNRAGSRAIVSRIGIIDAKVFVSNCEFNGANAAVQEIYLSDNTCKLNVASSSLTRGFYWNGIYGNLVGNNQFGTSSIPTGGTWQQGARFLNTVPSVGQPKGWICTVTGSPGTWVSEGNL